MRRLLVLLVPFALACGGDSSTAPMTVSVAGTWDLQTINGTGLPYVVAQSGSNKVELLSDVVTAVSSGSYTEIMQVRSTVNGVVSTQSQSDAGSFLLNGTAVQFQSNTSFSSNTGSISGNTFTLAENGFSYVYKRR